MDRTIGFVGLGLIGGSMAVDLRARGYVTRVLGTDKNPLHADAAAKAKSLGISLNEFIKQAITAAL